MNLIDLEAFVSVVDHRSIVAAAADLHLTQSAVTRRIQNLEDVLGTPLLDRHTRPLQPTRAGQETYEFAKPVLSSVNDLKTGIMHGGEPSGDFRFGMSRVARGSCDRFADQAPPRRFPESTNSGVRAMERGAFRAPRKSSPGLRRRVLAGGEHAAGFHNVGVPWERTVHSRCGEIQALIAVRDTGTACFERMGTQSPRMRRSPIARGGTPSARACHSFLQ